MAKQANGGKGAKSPMDRPLVKNVVKPLNVQAGKGGGKKK
jgi:hypothetical protein